MRAFLLPALLWPAAGGADTLDETHFARNFCWERTYSVQHLAEHPEQTVAAMRIGREPMGHPKGIDETLMEIEVTFRGEDGGRLGEAGSAVGSCRPDGQDRLRCSLEGSAGTYAVEAQGAGEILVTPGERPMTFETRRTVHELRADEGDDRAFVLRRCG